MLQTDNGKIYVQSNTLSEIKLPNCNNNSKLVFHIDTKTGKVSIKIDKNPPTHICDSSTLITDGTPLYLVCGLFFKKDRLKIKNTDKMIEKIENKVGDGLAALMQKKPKKPVKQDSVDFSGIGGPDPFALPGSDLKSQTTAGFSEADEKKDKKKKKEKKPKPGKYDLPDEKEQVKPKKPTKALDKMNAADGDLELA